MSLQNIIDTAQTIDFDRRRMVGQTISRSQRLRVSERDSAVAFRITVTPVARWRYSQYRSTLESLMTADRFEETEINLANQPGLRYLTEYQGGLNATQLGNLTIQQFTGTSVTITTLPAVATATVIFRPGDFIQPSNSRYPYIVTNTVLRGNTSTVTATVHRSLITSENTSTTGTFAVGTGTTLRLVVTDLPTYRLVQKDWAEFTGDFTLVEKII